MSVKVAMKLIIMMIMLVTQVRCDPTPRPDPSDAPRFACWLVSQSFWGVLCTVGANDKSPFGNILSFAQVEGNGITYFYQSITLDPTGVNAVNDSRASFTLTEYVLGSCGLNDPQFPGCAKLTLSGNLKLLKNTSKEGKRAEDALIAEHSQFAGFPKMKSFKVFKLKLTRIFLVNELSAAKDVPVKEYLNVKMK